MRTLVGGTLAVVLAGLVVVASAAGSPVADESSGQPPPLGQWGAETLAQIDRDLAVGPLYAESATPDGKKHGEHGPFSFVWPASFQLRALAAAAKVEPRRYRPKLVGFTGALARYWSAKRGLRGFTVLPSPSERFYDDNAWMLLGLIDAFEATRQKQHYSRAVDVLAFLMDGEKRTEGGGIRQHEDKPGGIFTCTAAPAAVGALRLHLIRKNQEYVAFAARMWAALTSREIGLQGSSGLFHQWARKEKDGAWHVERGERAYQSALPMQLAVLLHRVTRETAYLSEAQRIAEESIRRWLDEDGRFAECGQWGGSDLCVALLDLYDVDGNERWLETVFRVLRWLHEHGRDAAGRYGERWDEDRGTSPVEKIHLLYMAPVAQAYWRAAEYEKKGSAAGKRGRGKQTRLSGGA